MYWPSDTARHDEERPTHRTLAEATRKRQREAPPPPLLQCNAVCTHTHEAHARSDLLKGLLVLTSLTNGQSHVI